MTLIAINTSPDHVSFVTDEISYNRNLTSLGRATKALLIPHLDAAVLGQGDSMFTIAARYGLLLLANEVETFDELADLAPDLLPDEWNKHTTGRDASSAVMVLTGWSERDDRFITRTYALENDFKPTTPNGLWCLPSPWTARPTGLEARRLREFADPRDAQKVQSTLALWRQQPPWPAPKTPEEWRALAVAVREQRSCDGNPRVLIGGRVKLTTLTRGSAITETVHEFDDTGDELAEAVAWTGHPTAQVRPCHCGSGERFVDCHFAPYVDRPCTCGGDATFRECCMVELPAPATAQVAAG